MVFRRLLSRTTFRTNQIDLERFASLFHSCSSDIYDIVVICGVFLAEGNRLAFARRRHRFAAGPFNWQCDLARQRYDPAPMRANGEISICIHQLPQVSTLRYAVKNSFSGVNSHGSFGSTRRSRRFGDKRLAKPCAVCPPICCRGSNPHFLDSSFPTRRFIGRRRSFDESHLREGISSEAG